jgi:hypothetical protein
MATGVYRTVFSELSGSLEGRFRWVADIENVNDLQGES